LGQAQQAITSLWNEGRPSFERHFHRGRILPPGLCCVMAQSKKPTASVLTPLSASVAAFTRRHAPNERSACLPVGRQALGESPTPAGGGRGRHREALPSLLGPPKPDHGTRTTRAIGARRSLQMTICKPPGRAARDFAARPDNHGYRERGAHGA
jgi:hypothetical protein